MVFITRCTRSMMSAKSNSALADLKPSSSARRTCARNLAERINALDGTQPRFRHSPPILFFSISVTLALTAAAIYDATRPADPAPMTTILRSKLSGFVKLRSTFCAFMNPTTFLAISGKRPTSANEMIKPGDKISPSDSIFPSCVPAFT